MAAPEKPAVRQTPLSKTAEPGARVTLGGPDVSFAPLSGLSVHRATDLARLPQVLAGGNRGRSTEALLADPRTWDVEPGDILTDGNRYRFDGHQTSSGLRLVVNDFSPAAFAGAVSLDRRPSPMERPPEARVNVADQPAGPETPDLQQTRLTSDQAISLLRSFSEKRQPRIDLERDERIAKMLGGANAFLDTLVQEAPDSDFHHKGNIRLAEGTIIAPNHDRYEGLLFPHDLYFMSKAFRDTPNGRAAVESSLDNIANVYDEYGIIPQYTALSGMNAPARPVYISTAWEWFITHPERNSEIIQAKFARYMEIGAQEHVNIWNNPADRTASGIGNNHTMVPGFEWLRLAAEKDSGDNYQRVRTIGTDKFGSRFGYNEDVTFPLDLELILLRSKAILSQASDMLGRDFGGRSSQQWADDTVAMADELIRTHRDPESGTLFDFNTATEERNKVETIAQGWGLWAGLFTGDDALSIIGHLPYLESGYGLLTMNVNDLIKPLSPDDLGTSPIDPRLHRAVLGLHARQNWDAKIFSPEVMATTEGVIDNYILLGNKDISVSDRLATTRLMISTVQNNLHAQIDNFLKTGKFPEKLTEHGTEDTGEYQYEHQQGGLGWSAAHAKLNAEVYLPILYRAEDALQALVDDGKGAVARGVNLTEIRDEVLAKLRVKYTMQPRQREAARRLASEVRNIGVINPEEQALVDDLLHFARGDSSDLGVIADGKHFLSDHGVVVALPAHEMSDIELQDEKAVVAGTPTGGVVVDFLRAA